ncbi:MAG: ADP-ribosylglycohydrolase family protein, partial [Cyclobacteriaceae bacterium]|nr:ADP-ribosylglycohydrolase family protein [Cyclobacteriaceae bacterium]
MRKYLILAASLIIFSCSHQELEDSISLEEKLSKSGLSKEELKDRILGMIVGSAIGDAMGAPTEMWPRESIKLEYGFVTDLDSLIREASPEGIWVPNLPAGGTTDDTRWKVLTSEYLLTQNHGELNPSDFAKIIEDRYLSY